MIKIYSHPRSGTNYLAALIAKNLYPGQKLATRAGYVGHWNDRAFVDGSPYGRLFGGHGLPRRYRKILKPIDCYIYRDGRDVALSFWNSKHFINPDWRKGTFSKFIRRKLDWVSSPGDKANPDLTIFEHWKRHLELWQKSKVQLICYEELVQDPEKVLRMIAKGANTNFKKLKPINKSVGWFASSGGGVSLWKDHYYDIDLNYFYRIVGKCYGVYER